MKIYTKTGDSGSTGLFGGPRVSKDNSRIQAYGCVDELNAALGVARATGLGTRLDSILHQVQHHLFSIGAELATPEPEKHGLKWHCEQFVDEMESDIDQLETQLAPLRNFILPGGSMQSAQLHMSRTICRRVEREIVRFGREPSVSDVSQIVVYLNRLSDLLFVMARVANADLGVQDIQWHGTRQEKSAQPS